MGLVSRILGKSRAPEVVATVPDLTGQVYPYLKQIFRTGSYRIAVPAANTGQFTKKSVDESLICETFNEEIGLYYAVEEAGQLTLITGGRCTEMGQDVTRLRAFALRNLRRKAGDIRLAERDGRMLVQLDGRLESSLLLLDEFWDMESRNMRGELVAAAPTRTLLMFADSWNLVGVRGMQAAAQVALAGGESPLSSRLLARRDGHWQWAGAV